MKRPQSGCVWHLPVVVATLQTLYGVIACGRTVGTARVEVAAALAQTRYGCNGGRGRQNVSSLILFSAVFSLTLSTGCRAQPINQCSKAKRTFNLINCGM